MEVDEFGGTRYVYRPGSMEHHTNRNSSYYDLNSPMEDAPPLALYTSGPESDLSTGWDGYYHIELIDSYTTEVPTEDQARLVC